MYEKGDSMRHFVNIIARLFLSCNTAHVAHGITCGIEVIMPQQKSINSPTDISYFFAKKQLSF